MEYDKTLKERIDDRDWYCDTHGEIDREHLGVDLEGGLYCKMCEAAKIGQPNKVIGTSVIAKNHPDYAKNERAVSLTTLGVAIGSRRKALNASLHCDFKDKPISMNPRTPGVVV